MYRKFLLSETCLTTLGIPPVPVNHYKNNEMAATEIRREEKHVIYTHPVPLQAFLFWVGQRFKVSIWL